MDEAAAWRSIGRTWPLKDCMTAATSSLLLWMKYTTWIKITDSNNKEMKAQLLSFLCCLDSFFFPHYQTSEGGEEERLSERTHTSAVSSPHVCHTATWINWWCHLLGQQNSFSRNSSNTGRMWWRKRRMLPAYLWAPRRRPASAHGCQTEENTAAPAQSRERTPSGGGTTRWEPRQTQDKAASMRDIVSEVLNVPWRTEWCLYSQ